MLEEVSVIGMLCCGNNKWKGEDQFSCLAGLRMGIIYEYIELFVSCRRRQLAQLGSATGVYKTLVKYLVGVPQVWLRQHALASQ